MDKILQAIQALIIAVVGTPGSQLAGIKKVYYGDKKIYPEADLPAIAISPVSTQNELRGSRYDQRIHIVQIKLIYNLRDFFGGSGAVITDNKIKALEDAVKKIENSDANQKVQSDTIVGIIQNNLKLPLSSVPTAELAKVTGVEYLESVGRGFPTFEAIVTVEVIAIGDR